MNPPVEGPLVVPHSSAHWLRERAGGNRTGGEGCWAKKEGRKKSEGLAVAVVTPRHVCSPGSGSGKRPHGGGGGSAGPARPWSGRCRRRRCPLPSPGPTASCCCCCCCCCCSCSRPPSWAPRLRRPIGSDCPASARPGGEEETCESSPRYLKNSMQVRPSKEIRVEGTLNNQSGKSVSIYLTPTMCQALGCRKKKKVCKYVAVELKSAFEETGKTKEVIDTGYGILDQKASRVKYTKSDLRLIEVTETICKRLLDYSLHKERSGSNRFAKGMSETFETLHNLVHKGVKVVMDIPYELWNETSAEVADLKKQCDVLVEEFEEVIEDWYRNHQEEDLTSFLCANHVLKGKDTSCLTEQWISKKGDTAALGGKKAKKKGGKGKASNKKNSKQRKDPGNLGEDPHPEEDEGVQKATPLTHSPTDEL